MIKVIGSLANIHMVGVDFSPAMFCSMIAKGKVVSLLLANTDQRRLH